MNKRIRTTYPPEFKMQAIERAKVGDRSVRGLEQEMGLSPNLLRQWVQEYDKHGEAAFVRKVDGVALTPERGSGANGAGDGNGASHGAAPGSGDEARQRIRALERQVARLEEDKLILKKALTLLGSDLR